jgi:hypothetical protein
MMNDGTGKEVEMVFFLFYALILEFLIEAVEKLKSLSKSVRSQG